ncbi:MmcQ/YjbR family DNA-binding protein [Mucilaginibacter aquaedulcis]|uniref:MmcQ/YjbR family DNA-binding protein n=1 Tax=Mucilaginibacter aquaedulcis TaxID=1187081 RepID=UPI0025B6138A|nr:MmcQ/YjbR family DNA-binding protein [Mucilaginibacter aquaedulcis]MDN3547711.1 hypothetical protein [Mucilaginibacter aquaedulcis]
MATDMLVFMQFMRSTLLPLPGVTEKMCFDDPAFYVNKKIFTNIKLKNELLAIYTLERDKWIAADPDTFFITNHYINYKYMLVRLESVSPDDLKALLITAWCNRANKRQIKMHENETIGIKK